MSVKDRIKKQSRQEKGNEAITIILLKKKKVNELQWKWTEGNKRPNRQKQENLVTY